MKVHELIGGAGAAVAVIWAAQNFMLVASWFLLIMFGGWGLYAATHPRQTWRLIRQNRADRKAEREFYARFGMRPPKRRGAVH